MIYFIIIYALTIVVWITKLTIELAERNNQREYEIEMKKLEVKNGLELDS